MLASAAEDMAVCLWHLATGKRVWRHATQTRSMNGVAITPDERFVTSNRDNNQLVVLDAATGNQVGQIPASTRSPTALAVRLWRLPD